MGLTIVRHLVSDYGGTVKVIGHGDLGGAKFSITLPLQSRK
jgi:signal transduction histidine kinase